MFSSNNNVANVTLKLCSYFYSFTFGSEEYFLFNNLCQCKNDSSFLTWWVCHHGASHQPGNTKDKPAVAGHPCGGMVGFWCHLTAVASPYLAYRSLRVHSRSSYTYTIHIYTLYISHVLCGCTPFTFFWLWIYWMMYVMRVVFLSLTSMWWRGWKKW